MPLFIINFELSMVRAHQKINFVETHIIEKLNHEEIAEVKIVEEIV